MLFESNCAFHENVFTPGRKSFFCRLKCFCFHDMKMFNSIVHDIDWFSSSGGVIPVVCEHLSGGMCSLVIYRVMESNIETAAFFTSFWNIESLYRS